MHDTRQRVVASAPERGRRDCGHRCDELLARASVAELPEQRRLRHEAVIAAMPLARALAARYRNRGEPLEDLEQVAFLALVKAVAGYRPAPASSFLAYATPTVTGELRRHFRDHAWAVRPPRRLQELRLALLDVLDELTQQTGQLPDAGQVADRLELPEAEVREALVAMQGYTPVSLSEPRGLSRMPLAESIPAVEDDYEIVVDRLTVRPLLAKLSHLERRVLWLWYEAQWTQEQIAAEIGSSQVQVSRTIRRALNRIRAEVAA